MKYALNLADDGRILSVTFPRYAVPDAPLVDGLPSGDVHGFLFVAGKFISSPVPTDPKDAAVQTIAELKRKLNETDYNILKIVEGAATLGEMAEVIKQRAQWRKEINDLEVRYELYKK